MLKRGHIPTLLLGLSTIFLVVLSLFNYASFKDSSLGEYDSVFNLQDELQFKYLYTQKVFESAVNKTKDCSFKDLILERDTRNLEFGTFFSVVRNFDCEVIEEEGYRVIRLPEFSVSVRDGANEFMRKCNFEARISSEGVQYIYK